MQCDAFATTCKACQRPCGKAAAGGGPRSSLAATSCSFSPCRFCSTRVCSSSFFLNNLYLLDCGFNEKFLGLVTSAMAVGSIVGTVPAGNHRTRPRRTMFGRETRLTFLCTHAAEL